MKTSNSDRARRDSVMLAQVVAGISVLSFFFYLQRGDLLLYGDTVAHINIARRVFDSRTPGLLQLGTVWLPLPHLLMVPFLISDRLWQSGIAGSIPSMLAYLAGTMGIFRLVRDALSFGLASSMQVRAAAWITALVYAANPNLLYLQSTAMTEPLYLALYIWAAVYFQEWVQFFWASTDGETKSSSALAKCGLCLFAASLTRYDGWFLACTIGLAVFVLAVRKKFQGGKIQRSMALLVLLASAGPMLWLSYNAIVYRNPMEFASGPYSAKAIAQRDAALGHPDYPGHSNPKVSFSYFLKSAEMNLAPQNWGRLWLGILAAGILGIAAQFRRLWPLLLLGMPIPFYVLSISYSGVPIFLPEWWPFSFYNLRYGLELLPAFAVAAALSVHFALRLFQNAYVKTTILLAIIVFVAASYAAVWHAGPVCFQEAAINSRDRIPMESAVAFNLRKLPPQSTLLMYLGNHVGAVQQAGIPLAHVVNEGNHRPWKSPVDEEGLWERALTTPRTYVDYVVAIEGDPVDLRVNKLGMTPISVLHSRGEPAATIYWSGRDPRSH